MSAVLTFDDEIEIELELEKLKAEAQNQKDPRFNVTAPLWSPHPLNKPQQLAFDCQADVLGFGGSAGGGKALALNTPLPTPFGWSTMREVQVGDYLLDDQGVRCQIVATSEVFLKHKCYAVTFDDGEVIIADADHQWFTFTSQERDQRRSRTEEWRARRRATRKKRGSGKRPDLALRNSQLKISTKEPPAARIRTTSEIAATLRVHGDRANHSIPLAQALDLPRNLHLKPETRILPIQPYTLGAWLGDGKTHQGKIYVQDSDILIVFRVRADGYKVRDVPSEPIGRTILGLQPELRKLGVLGNKHIPTLYLRAPYRQRLALMQGLMDTDGHCDEDGGAEFTSTRKVLALGVLELARTLGIKATFSEGRAKLNGRDCGPKYRVKMTTTIRLFGLPRKAKRQSKTVRPTQQQRYIVDCVPVKSVPVKCVQVDSPSRMYLAGESMIPTHNSDLILGLAIMRHRVSKLFRREFAQLSDLIDRSEEIIGESGKLNKTFGTWRLSGGRRIHLLGVKDQKDVNKHKGRPADLFAFDEVTEFSEQQIRFLLGWNRSVVPGQRCRAVLCFNPPTTAEGRWVLTYFGPWLNDKHPNPALPGELRWYATTNEEEEIECANGQPFEHNGEMLFPRSRSFIPSSVEDNPYLANSGYVSVLQSLPGVLRAQMLYGDFKAGIKDEPWQVIPTAWVKLAQERWVKAGGHPGPGNTLDAIGIDVSRGGRDKTVLVRRYGHHYAMPDRFQGEATDNGRKVATLVTKSMYEHGSPKAQPDLNIDATGVGTSPYDFLVAANLRVNAIHNGEAADEMARDRSERLKFYNKRAQHYWKFMESLHPTLGDDIELPPDPQVLADLCSAHWELTTRGIKIEDKAEIAKRIGRSPDDGDALINASILKVTKSDRPAVAGKRQTSKFKMV